MIPSRVTNDERPVEVIRNGRKHQLIELIAFRLDQAGEYAPPIGQPGRIDRGVTELDARNSRFDAIGPPRLQESGAAVTVAKHEESLRTRLFQQRKILGALEALRVAAKGA